MQAMRIRSAADRLLINAMKCLELIVLCLNRTENVLRPSPSLWDTR
jgi:hypothetical protein